MAEQALQIRPFQRSDDKLVRFVIGKANLEPLAVSNRRAYTHPITLSVWLVLSAVIIEYMHWWPTNRYGFLGYFSPLPALAAMAVPIMALIDWLSRPYFEQQVQDVLRQPDIPDIPAYYSRSPSSGFWMLDYDNRFVGLIALDASSDPVPDWLALPSTSTDERSKESISVDSQEGSATIRHFYVDEAYRRTGIQNDLLVHTVNYAFRSSPKLQYIHASDSPLSPYIQNCLQESGFRSYHKTVKMSVFGWQLGIRTLKREDWEKWT